MEKNNEMPVFIQDSKETYEAPVIETVEVRVEQGFQASPSSPNDGFNPVEHTW
jgi:hypothetical protein